MVRALFIVSVMATATSAVVFPQSRATEPVTTSRFEAVSIKHVPPWCPAFALNDRCELTREPPATLTMFPDGRLEATRIRPIDLIRVAYRLNKNDRRAFFGGPEWLQNEHYDIIALTGTDGTQPAKREGFEDEVRMMLRGLLAERFKLRIEVTKQKADAILLRRIKNVSLGRGIRISHAECVPDQLSTELGADACVQQDDSQIQATAIPMTTLASLLSRATRFPVIDDTGLSGLYDVNLDAPMVPRPAYADLLKRALKTQLGLQLVEGKHQIDVLVIHGAEKPEDD